MKLVRRCIGIGKSGIYDSIESMISYPPIPMADLSGIGNLMSKAQTLASNMFSRGSHKIRALEFYLSGIYVLTYLTIDAYTNRNLTLRNLFSEF
jgi:hypothetical protein